MASGHERIENEKEILSPAIHSLTNADLDAIDKDLLKRQIITENEFYQLQGTDLNVRKRINDTIEIMSHKPKDSKTQFDKILHETRPDLNISLFSGPGNNAQYIENVKSSCYIMDKSPHGIAAIFQQEKFNEGPSRPGTVTDTKKLSALFEMLDYKVEVHYSLTKKGILKQIANYSAPTRHNNYDSFICVFLCHGIMMKDKAYTGNFIQAKDDKLDQEEIYNQFSDIRCPSLSAKPKIFIVEASCGASLSSTAVKESDLYFRSPFGCIMQLPLSDYFIAFASASNNSSIWDDETGSWFIENLVKVFTSDYKQNDMQSMLIKVRKRVRDRNILDQQGKELTQDPVALDGLLKKIYFTSRGYKY